MLLLKLLYLILSLIIFFFIMKNSTAPLHPLWPGLGCTPPPPSKSIPVKRVLDTEMNGYHCFNFTEKILSYKVLTLSNQKISNIHFDLSMKLSQGEVHHFSGKLRKFSGEVQNHLRGGACYKPDNLRLKLC
jgi:hypothetical protein